MFNLIFEIIIGLIMEIYLFGAILAFRDKRHDEVKDKAIVRTDLSMAIAFMFFLSSSTWALLVGIVFIVISLTAQHHYQRILQRN